MQVDLIVPLKPPGSGKSRLRGVLRCPTDGHRHADLVLALADDTLRAATATTGVRRVVVVGDPHALTALRDLDVELVGEDTGPVIRESGGPGGDTDEGLNAALRSGERWLRADDPAGVVGVLQADLPALRPDDLAAALAEADTGRAFAADRHGTGTTLLLSAPGGPLDPRFGPGSARAHADSGARPLRAAAPSLRGDVDTPADLDHARLLGLGTATAALLDRACLPR